MMMTHLKRVQMMMVHPKRNQMMMMTDLSRVRRLMMHLKEDEASSLVWNDSATNRSSLDQEKSLEDASQTVENDGMEFNTVPSVSETSNNMLKKIQLVKETMDANGFEIISSQVESVRHIFERHPDIAVDFHAKNQHLRNACMNFLLSLIETLCQSLEELSNEDLVEADIALTYLKDALAEKEKTELLATRTPLSFDDLV